VSTKGAKKHSEDGVQIDNIKYIWQTINILY